MNIKKLIACGLVIAACYICGSIYAGTKKRSFSELCGIIKLLSHIRTKISYTRTAIFDIINGFGDPALKSCGFTDCFAEYGRESVGNAWIRACDLLSVSDSVKNELKSLGESLGMLDTETQLDMLTACENILAAEKAEVEKLFDKRQKSYKTLGALTGAMIAIILY